MRNQVAAFALLLVLGGTDLIGAAPAPPVITRDDQKGVMVTIYNGNLGLVKDTREVQLGAGLLDVQLADVAAPDRSHHRAPQIAHRSVRPQDPRAELRVRPAHHRQADGEIRRQDRAALPAERDVPARHAAVDQRAGLRDQRADPLGHPGQVVLPALPENLVSRPTLVWRLQNVRAARQRVEAFYLTGGITWRADYVVVVDPADARADLMGWVTVDNKSGATYADAALELVAGDVNRARDRGEARQVLARAAPVPASEAASRAFQEETFFEYHLYTLDGRTTVKDNQTKQLALMAANQVPVDKHFVYRGLADYYRTAYGACGRSSPRR